MLLKGRNKGKLTSTIVSIKIALLENKRVAVMSLEETNYIDTILQGLIELGVENVRSERVTTTYPLNNISLIHDKNSEVIGVDLLPKKEKFIGWRLWIES